MKILIVEDDIVYGEGIKNLLEELGHEVSVLQDPTEENVKQSLTFGAEILLLDHDLGEGRTGDKIALCYNLPKEKIISISTGTFDVSYCGNSWSKKNAFDHDSLPPAIFQRIKTSLMKTIDDVRV